MVTVFS
jgi:hypothetical protein